MKRVLFVFLMFTFLKPCLSLETAKEPCDMGGCYVYSQAFDEKLRQTPGALSVCLLDETLKNWFDDPASITNESICGFMFNLGKLVNNMCELQNTEPAQDAALSRMYGGVLSKLRYVYTCHQGKFALAIENITEESDRVSFQSLVGEDSGKK